MTQLQRENTKLKTCIGDLTVELKKRRGVGMKQGPYAKVGARNHDLLASIRRIKADHPFWGSRLVWAYVRYMEQQMVPQKRIYRLMKLHGLLVHPICGSKPALWPITETPSRRRQIAGGGLI